MEYVTENYCADRTVQFAVRVWGCDMNFENPMLTAKEGIARFRAFLKSIGMPLNFEELGINDADISKLVEHLGVTAEISLGGFMKIFKKDAEAIYEKAASYNCK